MNLSSYHDLDHEFGGLTRVVFFFYPFNQFFFNFIFQYYIDLGLNFIICFNLISIELSRSHDLDRRFGRLTRVYPSHFFGSFLIDVFLISSFNIKFIGNQAS
jgi:hypothetical protein